MQGLGQFDRADVFALHVGHDTLAAAGEFVLGFADDDFDFLHSRGSGRPGTAMAGEDAEAVALGHDGDGFDHAERLHGRNQAFHVAEGLALISRILDQAIQAHNQAAAFGQTAGQTGLHHIESAFSFR